MTCGRLTSSPIDHHWSELSEEFHIVEWVREQHTLNNKLSVAEGRRPNVPLVIVVFTDGKDCFSYFC